MAKPADLTPQWTTQDRVQLREFLAKCPQFIRVLAAERPKAPAGADAALKGTVGLEIAQHFSTIEQIEKMASDQRNLQDLES